MELTGVVRVREHGEGQPGRLGHGFLHVKLLSMERQRQPKILHDARKFQNEQKFNKVI